MASSDLTRSGGSECALIVESSRERSALGVLNVPVHVNSHNLTQELSVEEDARFARSAPVNAERVRTVFRALYAAGPNHVNGERDRTKIVLCRLLLGPVAVPCYCDEWDTNEYMAEHSRFCAGPLLYVHRQCRCRGGTAVSGQRLAFSVMKGHQSTHVFRGLLSLSEWNVHLPRMFCSCLSFTSDRYVMACLPGSMSLHLDDYPYLMGEIGSVLNIAEIDECVQAMVQHLGQHVSNRVQIHYKLLFGVHIRPKAPLARSGTEHFFALELQKLWLSVEYHNETTFEFFERIFHQFHVQRAQTMLALRTPEQTPCALNAFSLSRFKRQVLYFKIAVTYGKHRLGMGRNVIRYRRLHIMFSEADAIWRNLFFIYYEQQQQPPPQQQPALRSDAESAPSVPSAQSRVHVAPCQNAVNAGATTSAVVSKNSVQVRCGGTGVCGGVPGGHSAAATPGPPKTVVPTTSSRLARQAVSATDLCRRRYICIVTRLLFARYRRRNGAMLDFTGASWSAAYTAHVREARRATQRYAMQLRKLIGGREFSEVTSVTLDRIAVNAFNTNRVINMKATLSTRPRPGGRQFPRNMTHSFVMYKHTFKEPACTVSTFVSNDAVYTNSLNVNIRGSYLEFLYALGVYRLYVNIDHFFLPAAVCNSNSSLDVHGLEDQAVIRSERSKVYWTTNFPCMISNTDNVNVGWFKAATAIVPRVFGSDLEGIMLKELTCIREMGDVCIDYGLHRVFTELEFRNSYQIPFLSKQLILFIRGCLLKLHGVGKRVYLDRFMFEAIKSGLFDYSKNTTGHTKIKHTCALIGSRLANNIPKILIRNKKIKLDHLGRNANVLTVCRHVEPGRTSAGRLKTLLDVLGALYAVSSAPHTRSVIRQTVARLGGRLEDASD
ncbi:protein UL87 [Aotine betaherpesvirus 1]|uniref:Protein UL87 n=1 Tax=Aotine betaherpesvirus 1 TaxID=50290 RepID=G8XUF3_9BETA|nr:protein UL87 [Aotine betaherpesvirus 1]AEV80783.1 protein UL87 [Aotine betaherpesvirus 1]